MTDNEKLIAILDGDWKDCSVSFMLVSKDTSLEARRSHNEREFPDLSFEEYLKKIDCGRDAEDGDIELYATGIDPNRKPSSV
jgi:hypothetical protein